MKDTKWKRSKVLFSLAFFSLCSFFSGSALAATAPVAFSNNNWAAATRLNINYSALQACQANYPLTTNVVPISSTTTATFTAVYNGVTYYLRYKPSSTSANQCKKTDGTNAGSWMAETAAYCTDTYPTGTTYTCATCPTGTIEQNGACILPPDCPATGKVTYPTFADGYLFVATASTPFDTGPAGTTLCLPYNSNLCGVKCSTGVAGPNPLVAGYAVACTSLTSTGSACPSGQQTVTLSKTNPLAVTPETGVGTEPTAPKDCPPGTGYMEINSVRQCLPSGSTSTGDTKTTTDSTAGTTTSTDKITINADGSKTTVTNNTITNVAGGTTTSTSTSTSSGTKSGDSGNNKPYDPGPAPTWTDPGNGGAVAAPTVNSTGLPAINWHQTYLPEGTSCGLTDIPLTVMNQTFSIPLSAACPYLPIFRGLIIFMSVLASIRMFAMAPW